jgi:hypothetical protein
MGAGSCQRFIARRAFPGKIKISIPNDSGSLLAGPPSPPRGKNQQLPGVNLAAAPTGLRERNWHPHRKAVMTSDLDRRQRSRRWRLRVLVPAGSVAALGGAAALVVTLTATVADAPSALAAVTAAAKTSAQSFRVTSSRTEVTSPNQWDNPPFRFTGVFDPRR